MDTSYVTVVAALGGAALGGFTSFATSWTTLRVQMRANKKASSTSRRQELYKQFIEDASRVYGDALTHEKLELTGLIGLYAHISRMRVLSTQTVIENAIKVVQVITDAYKQPNKTPDEVDDMIRNGRVDLLQGFSDACRAELETNVSI
jgi:hypothetical protein